MDFLDMRDRIRSFAALAGFLDSSVVVGGTESAMNVNASFVSAEFFAVLGVEPLAGRFFRPDEDREGGDSRVAVLSESLWKERYGRDRSVLGRRILVEGSPYEVVGVAPDDSLLLENAGVIAPLVNQAFSSRSGRVFEVVGRLRSGVTLGTARLRLAAAGLVAGIAAAITLSRLLGGLLYGVRPADPLTFGGAAILLLIVALCASFLPARRAALTNPVAALRSP